MFLIIVLNPHRNEKHEPRNTVSSVSCQSLFQVLSDTLLADQSEAACKDNDATLPLPTSQAQSEDLGALLWNTYSTVLRDDKTLIGVSDLGSRFYKDLTQF